MMTFDLREDNREKEFIHDEELRFRATARRNKLVGFWAADKMGLTSVAADKYAQDLVIWNINAPKEAGLIKKIVADLRSKGVTLSESQVQRIMDQLMGQAVTQLATMENAKDGK